MVRNKSQKNIKSDKKSSSNEGHYGQGERQCDKKRKFDNNTDA